MGIHFDRAQAWHKLKRYKDAAREYMEELAEDPESVLALAGLASVNIGLHNLIEAERFAQQAIRLLPDWAYLYYLLSIIYGNDGYLYESYAAANEAIRLDPYDADYHRRLAELHFHFEQVDDALQKTADALQCNPHDISTLLLRGKVLARLGRMGESKEVFEFALSLNPEHAQSHLEFGKLNLERAGYSEDALRMLTEARRLDPIESNDLMSIAQAYGRTSPPLVWIDRFIPRLEYIPHFYRWLIAMIISIIFIGLAMKFGHGLSDKHKKGFNYSIGWYIPSILFTNYLALAISYGPISSFFGLIAIGKKSIEGFDVGGMVAMAIIVLIIHLMAVLLGAVILDEPAMAIIFCYLIVFLPIWSIIKPVKGQKNENSWLPFFLILVILAAGMLIMLGITDPYNETLFYCSIVGDACFWLVALYAPQLARILSK